MSKVTEAIVFASRALDGRVNNDGNLIIFECLSRVDLSLSENEVIAQILKDVRINPIMDDMAILNSFGEEVLSLVNTT